MLDVDVGLYSARKTVLLVLRPRQLCVQYVFGSYGSWFVLNQIHIRTVLLDVDIGLYSARTTNPLLCVRETFESTTPTKLMVRGSPEIRCCTNSNFAQQWYQNELLSIYISAF
jgi:hypothetical protein